MWWWGRNPHIGSSPLGDAAVSKLRVCRETKFAWYLTGNGLVRFFMFVFIVAENTEQCTRSSDEFLVKAYSD